MSQILDVDEVNYTEMRRKFAPYLDQCTKFGKRFKIVRNGKPEAVLVSTAEWEQILETLAIITHPKLMKQLVQSDKDVRAGRVQKLDEAFGDLLG